MTKYSASFANGKTIELETKRTCTVGYLITTPKGEVTGFSVSEKAAIASINNLVSSVPKQDQSKAANAMRDENAKFLSACRIEIAPAIAA